MMPRVTEDCQISENGVTGVKLHERQTKRQIKIDYEWDGEEANLSNNVSNWVKTYLVVV